jgi:hypothetical protein
MVTVTVNEHDAVSSGDTGASQLTTVAAPAENKDPDAGEQVTF